MSCMTCVFHCQFFFKWVIIGEFHVPIVKHENRKYTLFNLQAIYFGKSIVKKNICHRMKLKLPVTFMTRYIVYIVSSSILKFLEK